MEKDKDYIQGYQLIISNGVIRLQRTFYTEGKGVMYFQSTNIKLPCISWDLGWVVGALLRKVPEGHVQHTSTCVKRLCSQTEFRPFSHPGGAGPETLSPASPHQKADFSQHGRGTCVLEPWAQQDLKSPLWNHNELGKMYTCRKIFLSCCLT